MEMKNLFIGDSCMLAHFVESLKKQSIFEEISYTFYNATSTCIFDEVNNQESIVYKKEFDLYMIGMGDTLRKELYFLTTTGVNDKNNKNFFEIIDSLIERLEFSIEKIRQISKNPIFLNTYIIDIYQNKMFSYKYQENPIKYHFIYLCKLYEIAERNDNVFIFDVNKPIGKLGYTKNLYRHEMHGSHIESMGGEILCDYFLEILKGLSNEDKIKVVVIDLDNTIWNGVLRESEWPLKTIYFRIQVLYQLIAMGIIICVSSKNDDDIKTLEKIKETLGDFSNRITIYKVNWNRKSENIKEIAIELNVGLDSIAFFDDQEFERDEVKSNLPQVNVFSDQELETILENGRFNFVKISEDSKNRGVSYQRNIKRNKDELNSKYEKYEDYLKTLDLKIKFRNFQESDLVRAHELISRTNQQNFTLNRFSENDILIFHKSHNIIMIELEDNFGPYGTIGCLMVEINSDLVIKEFALSCRAMGKKLEECVFIFINNLAMISKANKIKTFAKETEKNKSIIDQLKNFGFVFNENGSEKLVENLLDYPIWFNVNNENEYKLL